MTVRATDGPFITDFCQSILSYVVSEPGEWSSEAISMDLAASHSRVRASVAELRALGLVAACGDSIVAMRRVPSTLDAPRVAQRRAQTIWEAIMSADAPVSLRWVSERSGTSPNTIARCIGVWRDRNDLSEVAALWPTAKGRAVMADRLNTDNLPPVMPVRRVEGL